MFRRMFAPLSRFFNRPAAPEVADRAFVTALQVQQPREPRNRRSERVLVIGWLLIVAKSVAVYWACAAFPQVAVSPWSIIVPTLLFACLCTGVYLARD